MIRTDLLADNLNQISVCLKHHRSSTNIRYFSSRKLLPILDFLSENGYLNYEYGEDGGSLDIQFDEGFTTIKYLKRAIIKNKEIPFYVNKFLPGSGIGHVLLSTSLGVINAQEAYEKGVGGALYCYVY